MLQHYLTATEADEPEHEDTKVRYIQLLELLRSITMTKNILLSTVTAIYEKTSITSTNFIL
jgi:hypothetical protein